MFNDLGKQIYRTIIEGDRWKLYLDGLGTTMLIAGLAIVLGVTIGSLVAIAKVNAAEQKRLRWLGAICNLYTTVIRGTPMVVQLLIMYFIVFASAQAGAVYIAALAFGINSGAYVSEIVRAGIQSIDRGQAEAGRSLGLSRAQTMRSIILPQAIKNIFPALCNEFIMLFKETSVVGYIAITDLTRAGELIRSRTFMPFVPLTFVAIIYLAIVLILTRVFALLEKKLATSDAR